MGGILTQIRFPTLLGLTLLLLGIGSGVYLTVQNQTVITQAAPDQTPQDIRISNIEPKSVTISWRTNTPVSAFVNYGENQFISNVAFDIRDQDNPGTRSLHYVLLKDLTPAITYQYKIVSGKLDNLPQEQFTTPAEVSQSDLKPIIGNVLDNNEPLSEGIVYLEIPGSILQSALVKNFGSFIIPINSITPTSEEIKIVAITSDNRQGSVTLKLSGDNQLTKPIKIGEDQIYVQDNFGTGEALGIATTFDQIGSQIASKFDLNEDGKINSLDYAYLLQNFGHSPKDKKADLNKDGVVNKKDQDIISGEINKAVNQ